MFVTLEVDGEEPQSSALCNDKLCRALLKNQVSARWDGSVERYVKLGRAFIVAGIELPES